ncbi:LexA family transcriptional regulator [Reyranella sp. CPCC 100927]|uniref:LexA family protein n=1 Tax=Reyranella sp. CPCC 100927 TaxID=2599616 RepID=UPI0011B64F06|nr:hypothetical protein [Reyranella sp. CPCC 100927]TWT11555.1 hypothetical protein FQU96_13845 [Reyranella sp. CPCC 100927]
MSLTPQQHRLLVFIAERIRATGVCPSNSEMMEALQTKARGNIHALIGLLEERGYVRRLFRHRARCLEVLRLPDEVSEAWLRAVSTGAMARELARRGIGPQTQPAHVLCQDCGAERIDSEEPRKCTRYDSSRWRIAP